MNKKIAILGGTGYVGSRLVESLLSKGFYVRALSRNNQKLSKRFNLATDNLENLETDLNNKKQLSSQLEGCEILIYLVHSMSSAENKYDLVDDELALNTAEAAKKAGVDQIIYLSGLGDPGDRLSKHLRSRHSVEQKLRTTGVPVTVLKAAMIIGSGSASFEILRYLVERLPLMITPRWVRSESQPIGIKDVIDSIVACVHNIDTKGKTLEIGGSDIRTYQELMRIVAVELGLKKRIVIPVPILTPKLSALWIHLVTPVPSSIARPLAAGLSNRVVCKKNAIYDLLERDPLSCREAIHDALAHTKEDDVFSTWKDSGPIPTDPDWSGGKVFIDQRSVMISANIESVFKAVTSIGGDNGYFASDFLWRLRGFIDSLIGGPGLRRGRRNSTKLIEGDSLDFWRVLQITENKRLVLIAEMRLPGKAVLEFVVEHQDGIVKLNQIAKFRPKGLLGILYWYSVAPLHGVVFAGMLNGIRNKSIQIYRSG